MHIQANTSVGGDTGQLMSFTVKQQITQVVFFYF